MSTQFRNISFDGSPVELRMDSPWLVSLDPLGLDWVREQLSMLPADAQTNIHVVLDRVNANQNLMSCYEIQDFLPGTYVLDPRDIRKFGDEDDNFDYSGDEEEGELTDERTESPFISVDSGAIVLADFSHLAKFVELLNWKQYDLALQDDAVFTRVTQAFGGPYFGIVFAGTVAGAEFDSDGVYIIASGAIRRLSSA